MDIKRISAQLEGYDGPSEVFKFRSWNDGENNEVNKILSHRIIRMSSPSQLLPDYPECILPVDFDSITEEGLMRVAYKHAKNEFPFAPDSDLKRIALNKRRRMVIFDEKRRDETKRFYDRKLHNCTGIFCTTYDYQSLDTWENLGCMGENYCIGFDPKKLFLVEGVSGSMGYVMYYPPGRPPKLRPYNFSKEEVLDEFGKIVRSVPSNYSHEREFRFTRTNYDPVTENYCEYSNDQRFVEIPKDAFTRLILGDRMSQSDINEIVRTRDDKFPELRIEQIILDHDKDRYRSVLI